MTKKRILSTLIALVMCAGILPPSPIVPEVTALAASDVPIVVRRIGEGPTSDSFVAGTMDNQWTILRPITTGPLAYEIEKGRGLKLKTQAAGMQTTQNSTPENVFTRPGNADQWEAVAKVYFPTAPNQNYQQIAFGVIDDDYNYVKLDIEFNTTTRRVQFSINRNGVYSHTHWTNLNNAIFSAEAGASKATDMVAYYKIVKNNDTYKAYVSFDGETYYTVGSRSGNSGGSNTNGEYTVEYNNPKIYVSAIKDYNDRSAVIDTYCEFVKIYNINGESSTFNVLESAFNDTADYVIKDDNEALKSVPAAINLLVGSTYKALAFGGLPKVPYGYNYRLAPANSSALSVNNTTGAVTAKELGTTTMKLELVQGTRTRLIKTVKVNIIDTIDPVTVQFDYNYTEAPARPDSFTKQTGSNGKLESFPVEQTLPQAGSRADYGFVGWYTNPEGTGEKVTLDTVFTEDTNLYAKWEQVPSLYKEYEDYFLMGAFQDYNSTTNAQWNKHYNVMCPSNNFKLSNQIDTTTMRNNFTAARNRILADTTMTDKEKEEALQRANEEIVLRANPGVMTQLNNIRAWNEAHPDEKKYTRFHVVAWHGGQQPNIFFANGYQYTNDATSLSKSQNLIDANQDGAFASRETMKARLDNYIKLLMERYEPYKDIIISWDIVNEPVDDFTGQIRNGSDSNSQRGQWGLIWHDMNPARNSDGSLKFTTTPDYMGVINNPARLYDESEWMRWAFESSAKWTKANNCDWGLYVNDYMDSNKLYTKLQPTLDIMQWIRDDVDMQGIKLGWGLQGRLAWAYPTIDMLRKQVEDGLAICDELAVTEADIRSDFEPNPFFDPSQPSRPVRSDDSPQWINGDLNSGSGSSTITGPGQANNTFDTHNSPVRRIPEWGTGNGLTASSERYNAVNYLPISEEIMKKQADFAADWMDILIDHADKVEVFQWDGYSDSNTFNSSKAAHLWVNSGIGRTGTFEKYSFFAVIGAPARDKLRNAINACPALTDADKFSGASAAWAEYVEALDAANALVDKRIYTLEGVNDVKDATKALYDAAAVLEKTCAILTYNANGGSGAIVKEGYTPGTNAAVKTDAAVGFSNPGYTFIGWNTNANGSGTSYTGGATIKMDNNVTLYAQWKADPKACTVAFESYGGTEVASVNVMEGEKVSKPADPGKVGYRFGGWYRDMALSNKWDFANGIVTGNMRLYAKWVDLSSAIDPVTVQFDYNYTGAPALPDTFTKQTGSNGKLESFPIEQTLPQVGSRADYGFVGWYTNPEGTGEKVTLDTVFTEDTNLYAKWEQVPSLYKEYEDYFLMGAFQDYNSTPAAAVAQWNKHYNVMCPSNNFKLTNQIDTTTMRNNFTAARNRILADTTMTDTEKDEALQRANEEIVLRANPSVMTQLNNIRAWNAANPNDKKYTRFHVVAWHGGQQPNQFFANGYQYADDATSLSKSQNLLDANQDGAFASRETMKARLDNYIKLLMERYEPYKDIIISWDIVNEPVDDFTGQIRNGTDSSSQRGQWGLIWHDMNPARNSDGSLKFTTTPDAMGVINNPARLYDESEWMRWAFESSAKWTRANNCDWGLYVNDYMDSNKLYTKLQPTLDITKWIRDDVDMQGIKLGWGMQGRLAWAYPTIDMLRKQVEDGLEICDELAITEADIRSDFEPNPYFDPTQPTRPVLATDTNQWTTDDLTSNSGNYENRSTLMNCFDTYNSPVRRIPEWGTGNGMTAGSARYDAENYLPISEDIMKKQADFAADWMDILIDHADKVEVFQWDGYSDSNTFNRSKGAHLWVNSGITGRTGTFEKYSFFAVIGAPARDKLRNAINACPALTDADKFADASAAWAEYVEALDAANALVDKRIYTLEGVNDVKDATKALYDAAAVLEKTCTILTYNANGGSGAIVKDGYTPGANAAVKTDAAAGFSKSGYTFIGWNTNANGSGTSYTGGATIKMDNNVTLYAQWKADPKACTVAFESYGGTEVASVNVMEGEKVSKPADPGKIGYRFDGWYRDMALSNKWDFANGIVTGNMRLYAKWVDSASRFDAYINDSGNITVEFHNADTEPVSGTFFVAIYDEGVLVRVEQQQFSAPASSVDKKTFDINIADYANEQYQVKAFAWGSDYAPLDNAIVIK